MPADLATLMVAFLKLLTWVVIARVLASWFVQDPRHPVMRTLGTLTDPF
ncbi:MAG: YggT family protein, partial [Myxococcota bacterium]